MQRGWNRVTSKNYCWWCYHAVGHLLKKWCVPQSLKVHLYKTIIMLTVINGAESSTLTNKMERVSMMLWKMKILRKIHTPLYKNSYCRAKINQETYNKFQSPNTVSIINPSVPSYLNSCSPGLLDNFLQGI